MRSRMEAISQVSVVRAGVSKAECEETSGGECKSELVVVGVGKAEGKERTVVVGVSKAEGEDASGRASEQGKSVGGVRVQGYGLSISKAATVEYPPGFSLYSVL